MNLDFAIRLGLMLKSVNITNLTVIYILLSVALFKDVCQIVLTRKINTHTFFQALNVHPAFNVALYDLKVVFVDLFLCRKFMFL